MQQDAIWDYYQNEQPENFAVSKARLAFLARKAKPAGKTLDIGVGNGIFEELALQRGLDVYALDPSERSIETLRARLELGDKARVGYGQHMPFEDAFFDTVVISEVLEHLSNEVVVGTLSEIARVLVPGGCIIGTVPAREDLRKKMVVCLHCGKRFHNKGHVQSFDEQRLQTLLKQHFIVEDIQERRFVTWSALNWKGKTGEVARLVIRWFGVRSPGVFFFQASKPHSSAGPS
jgi:SAM-dependent methyltransferase